MNTVVKIRVARVSDVEAVLPLFRRYQAHYSQLTTATEEKTRAFLVDLVSRPDQGFALVAETESGVVGFATGFVTVSGVLAERMVHLGDLYVDSHFRRQGVATKLISGVVDQARSRGLALVRWLSLASNTELNQWYESLGATSGEFRLFLKPVKKETEQQPSEPMLGKK